MSFSSFGGDSGSGGRRRVGKSAGFTSAASAQRAPKKLLVMKYPKAQVERTEESGTNARDRLFHSLYDAVINTTFDGHIMDVNARAETQFKISRQRLCQMNILELIEQADKDLLSVLVAEATPQRYTLIEAGCKLPSGQRFLAEIAVSCDSQMPESRLSFFIRDISERKERDVLLRTVHNAVMNSPDGIAVARIDGTLAFVNPSFQELWGGSGEKQILNRDIRTFFETSDGFTQLLKNAAARHPGRMELVAIRQDKSLFPAEVHVVPNIDEDDVLIGIVFSVQDVSDRHLAKEMTQKAAAEHLETERVKTRLETVTALGYAINNPLQNILSIAEIEGNAKVGEQVNRIIDIVRKLQTEETQRLPAEPVVPAVSKKPRGPHPVNAQSILQVDDEELILTLFGHVLKAALPEVRVDQAINGAKALELFADGHQAVVIIDICMPGMDGLEVYREIDRICAEKNWEKPRVIFCTGFITSAAVNQVVDGERVVTLTKPVRSFELVEAINRLMPPPIM